MSRSRAQRSADRSYVDGTYALRSSEAKKGGNKGQQACRRRVAVGVRDRRGRPRPLRCFCCRSRKFS